MSLENPSVLELNWLYKNPQPSSAASYAVGSGTASFSVYSQSAGTSASPQFAHAEVPSGTIDGTNATFTLAHTPIANTVQLYLNGVRMRPTTDYSVSTNTITYTSGAKPKSGDNHVADYQY